MSFNNTQSDTINKMIEFGTKIIDSNLEFDIYIKEMIHRFFPGANIDIITKMLEWAKYPTLCMITLDNLKDMEINERTTKFKKQVKDTIVSQDQYNAFNNMIELIRGCSTFGYYKYSNVSVWEINNQPMLSWNNITIFIQDNRAGFGPNQHNMFMIAENIISHIKFTETIRSIWMNNNNRIQSRNEKFEQSLENLTMINDELCKQVQSLTSQIKKLENKNQLLQDRLNTIEGKYTPELIKYDYDEIRARLDPIRSELKITQRIFARIIRNHYEVPLAISVLPTKCA